MYTIQRITKIVVILFVLSAFILTTRISGVVAGLNNNGSDIKSAQTDYSKLFNYTGTLAYDSGWEALGIRPDPISVEFTHNIGGDPDDYVVSLECRDNSPLGRYDCTDHGFNVNVHWYDLTDTTVKVFAIGGSRPDDVRVRIYKVTPMYDSGWEALGIRPDPISMDFTHNLGGDPDNYIVSLECRDNSPLGRYDCTSHWFKKNVVWYGLTNTTVKVFAIGGSLPDDVRVRIFTETPTYDSGWEVIGIRPDPISMEFTHNLGGDPDDYVVSLECRDDITLDTYDCTDHGFNANALWYDLTTTTVKVFVIGGSRPDDVRVRIWRAHSIYLPILFRNY